MKTTIFSLLLLAAVLMGCAAPAANLPAADLPPSDLPPSDLPPSVHEPVMPQTTEKVVAMATQTLPPDLPTVDASTPTTVPGAKPAVISNQTATPPGKVVETAAGQLVFSGAKFVDEVHGTRPSEGQKILLVFFQRVDGGEIDLELFRDQQILFKIRDENGSEWTSSMGGWVDGQFAQGFMVPEGLKTIRLVWPDQEVTDITAAIEAK